MSSTQEFESDTILNGEQATEQKTSGPTVSLGGEEVLTVAVSVIIMKLTRLVETNPLAASQLFFHVTEGKALSAESIQVLKNVKLIAENGLVHPVVRTVIRASMSHDQGVLAVKSLNTLLEEPSRSEDADLAVASLDDEEFLAIWFGFEPGGRLGRNIHGYEKIAAFTKNDEGLSKLRVAMEKVFSQRME